MTSIKNFAASTSTRVTVGLWAVAMVLGFAQMASATDPVTTAFSDAQTSLLAYIALGIGVIVALLLAGIGVRLLVKYVRKAASAA